MQFNKSWLGVLEYFIAKHKIKKKKKMVQPRLSNFA